MGWLYMPSQGSSPLDTIRAYLAPDELVSASHDRYENAYYLAVRFARGDFRGRVGGVVALYEERNGGAEIGVKLIEEWQGPFYRRCPARILDALTPVGRLYPKGSGFAAWAKLWRDECRAQLRLQRQSQKWRADLRMREQLGLIF